MAMGLNRGRKEVTTTNEAEEKSIEINAKMQGTMSF